MGRTRYVIQKPDKSHFLTCTVVEWLSVFTRLDAVQKPGEAGIREHPRALAVFERAELPQRAGADRDRPLVLRRRDAGAWERSVSVQLYKVFQF